MASHRVKIRIALRSAGERFCTKREVYPSLYPPRGLVPEKSILILLYEPVSSAGYSHRPPALPKAVKGKIFNNHLFTRTQRMFWQRQVLMDALQSTRPAILQRSMP
jgi:hypothetical protein